MAPNRVRLEIKSNLKPLSRVQSQAPSGTICLARTGVPQESLGVFNAIEEPEIALG